MPVPDEDAVSDGGPPPQPPAKKSATDDLTVSLRLA